jgi:hypothetical protein
VAAISWYLSATTANSWRTIDESTAAAGKNTDGWVVSTGSTNHSEYAVGVERAATTFTGTTVPDGTLDTSLFDAFRTTNAYNGSFASANWTFVFSVQATTNGGAQDGRIRFRLIKANADGSSATEITSGQQQGSLVSNVATTGTFESSLTFNPGAFSVSNQYLFVQIAWERTGAGGMTTSDINWVRGSGASTGTRITSADFTAFVDTSISATRQQMTLTDNNATVAYDRSVTATKQSMTLTAYAATVETASNTEIAATSQAMTLTANNASVAFDVDIQATSQAMTLTANAVVLTFDREVFATSQAMTLTPRTASVVFGAYGIPARKRAIIIG